MTLLKNGVILLVITLVSTVTVSNAITSTGANNNKNMNGLYNIANPNMNSKNKYNTLYSARGEQVEYFDVYSPPIQTRYGEVFWTLMDPVKLPQDIQDKFKNLKHRI